MSGKIIFVWKNIEYYINQGHNHLDFTELPSGEFLAIGDLWKPKTEPNISIPICLILLKNHETSKVDPDVRFVCETSPHLSNMLENSHNFTEYKAIASPYLDRYICSECNQISQDFFLCEKCGAAVKHEVVLEWPGPSPITTVYGVYIVTPQATCPSCQTQLSLDEQPSKCPNCMVCLQWHITPSTPHMAY